MRHLAALALLALAMLAPAVGARAQAPAESSAAAPDARAVLRVGIQAAEPFAMERAGGAWLGLAADMWRIVAETNGWDFDFVAVDPADPLAALGDGTADLVLPVQATAAGLERAEFTLPLYTATLAVAGERENRILGVLSGFLSWQFLRLVAGLSVLLLIVGAIVWAIERRSNHEMFARSPLRGLGDGFWWAGVTLTTIGYGDKAPATFLGRAVAMLWMLMGLAVSAALTAAVVTLAGTERGIDLPEDLRGRSVAVVEGSTAAAFLGTEGIETRAYPDLQAALEAAQADETDAAAGPAPQVAALVDGLGTLDLRVQKTTLDPQMITIALPPGSGLRAPIDRAILTLFASETGWELTERYVPD
ncbi:ion channel [Wenxinia saemankumensis]|uniref:Amino acid ABC transporter substrate-binding protein, PAAT family n=1 Tax=Wenxinia saemankumensis TaxID=1447782 RepID=A0A1M6CG97_9RHOB|nr:transporter substrate-binding domain-containing protein [Wenxinia saemankumensis]SHI59871.1 amino acid ABC transporter substrate-binding protein, PAAT family [Wenxinia saemankumensis]